ncbi:hypothetical protein CDD83_6405 [Cordyceps sp. RAO-2017]|nr:hypothetical protein CDD83_6405 [Cordyceps sp. RAO-2017]
MTYKPSNAATSKVAFAARNCIRTDYVQFLEVNLPRWHRDGLWHQTWPSDPTIAQGEYEKLQKAYSCVCRIDMRMGDDPIRSRMAMISLHLEYEKNYRKWKARDSGKHMATTGVGRGNASSLIDNILENTHREWDTTDTAGKAELRAKFHDRKRYGKRWWLLANALGPSILVLCSSRFAGMVRNTTVTATMIKAIAQAIQADAESMSVLDLVRPVAETLFHNHDYQRHDPQQLLRRVRGLRASQSAQGEYR